MLTPSTKKPAKIFKKVEPGLSEELQQLYAFGGYYSSMSPDNQTFSKSDSSRVSLQIEKLLKRFETILKLVDGATPEVKQELFINYEKAFERLNRALSTEFLGEVLLSPDSWTNPVEKYEGVLKVFSHVEEMMEQSISQLNKGRELEFNLNLGLLEKPF